MAANQSRDNVPMATGQITEWNPDRGFGFLESDGRRIFLHAKDFAQHYKVPEVGDRVSFKMGVDKQGRPCAQKAVHINEGGRITSEALFLLAFLVGAPICALVRLAGIIPGSVLAIYAVTLPALTYLAYAWDKHRARKKGQREPEALLHLLEFLGGWPGAFIAHRRIRHKCSKASYQLVFWLIVAAHELIAIDYLRGWAWIKGAAHALKMALIR
ncbi:MAG TPA: DUF1294 domain-containing protein [Lacunisphaera sp.]|jgi:uncharacterized membrane protein YsdA (DUF1294 family)